MNAEQLNKVLTNMRAAGLKQLLVSAPMSILYVSGRHIAPGERLAALLVRDDDEPVLIANSLFAQCPEAGMRLVEYADTDDSAEVLSSLVKGGVLGVDKDFPCRFALPLMDKRADVKLVLGSACVDRARMCKTPAEIAIMARASKENDAALSEAIKSIRVGMTEKELAGNYVSAALSRGASGESFDSLICFGASCAEPHHETGSEKLKTGDSVILDVGLRLDGYCSDMTRTVFCGAPTDEQKRVYDLVLRANAAGRAAAKPGVKLKDIDRAARSVIEDAGYGKYFIHRTGHGIGLDVHEFPDVSAVSEETALPGMVFSVEPGVYLPGRFGVRTEDLVAITEDGAITLNALPRELMRV